MRIVCRPTLDVWRTVAELSNELKTVDISDVKFYSQHQPGETQTLADHGTAFLHYINL